MKKWLVSAIVWVLLLAGCSGSQVAAVYEDDSRISSDVNSYNLSGASQEVEGTACHISVEKMEGMDTLWSCETEADTEMQVSCQMNLESGKLKLVLISPDGTLTTLAESTTPGEKTEETTVSLPKGESRMKLVAGEDTQFDLTVSVSEGEFRELGF